MKNSEAQAGEKVEQKSPVQQSIGEPKIPSPSQRIWGVEQTSMPEYMRIWGYSNKAPWLKLDYMEVKQKKRAAQPRVYGGVKHPLTKQK